MEICRPSSPRTVMSSVCDACQGLFDMSSPRGFVIDGEKEMHWWGYPIRKTRYIYTYIHHRSVLALESSALAGCDMCRIISGSLEYKLPDDRLRVFSPHPQRARCPQPASGAHPEESEPFRLGEMTGEFDSEKHISENGVSENDESDKDDWEPAKLAHFVKHFVKQQGLDISENIHLQCNGRVVIQRSLKEQDGLALNAVAGIGQWSVNSSPLNETDTQYEGIIYNFTSLFDPVDPDWRHRPSRDLLSESHTGLVNRWRNTCDKEHESCRKISYDQPLPTRVLEILGSAHNTQRVRLVETQGKERGAYVCLSYCWGDLQSQAGRTTRLNLVNQLENISLHDLPSTVLDAIRLCYKLGYRFLWVDRLCIIQDDENDWLMEASRMCDVYSRSALTISVPICKDSSQSFLAERQKGFREQDRFAIVSCGESAAEKHQRWVFWCRLSKETGPWFLEECWDDYFDITGSSSYGKDHWLGRSWTFQEWILSPRVLHIDSMTLWDCFDGYANELRYRNMVRANLLRDPTRLGEDIPWGVIVQEYSARKITRVEDKLPALAGLAERYAYATGKTYLAGLWLEDLPGSLLWIRKSRDETPQAWTASCRTPSWSWAKLNNAIRYDISGGNLKESTFTALASVQSSVCQFQPPGSFARVEHAWLYLDCRVTAVTERQRHWVWEGGRQWRATADYDFDHENSDWNDVENVYLLLLGWDTIISFAALIAKRYEGDDGGTCFRRLGVAILFETSVKDLTDGPEWREQVIRLV